MKELSFCIPTYNRSTQCIKLVKEILTSKNENIEVIVSDNCSSDDTILLLKQIKDKRLCLYQSKVNNGSLFNIFNTFSKARGKYIYFTTDKDFIKASNIDSFISFLQDNKNLSCGYCEYFPKTGSADKIYLQGFEAVNKVGYTGRHPSGYFFHREKLENMNYIEKFSDIASAGGFFFDFILAELALKGSAAIFYKQLTIPQSNNDAAKDKSLSIKGMHINAYYAPDSRLRITVNQTIHINSLRLSLEEKRLLISKIFMFGLINATYGFKKILNNKNICEHYYLEKRNVTFLEMTWIGLNFYRKYLNQTKLTRKENNVSFNFYIFKLALNKILKRLNRAK
jgi:glycosyltransferase involved in cell wall biosynthesis